MKSISTAKVVPLKDENTSISIDIPFNFQDSPTYAEENEAINQAVIIYIPSSRTIKINPAKSGEIARIDVSIGELTPDFLHDVSDIFMDAEVKVLYSTGVCFTSEGCIYEVYIIDLTSKDLQDRLREIKGVEDVTIELLTS